MKSFLLAVLFLPVDALRLTIDLSRLAACRIKYCRRKGFLDQPCCFCREGDNGCSPRPLPAALRKYRNRWMITPWLPCLKKVKIQRPSGIRKATVCTGEGGYIPLSRGTVPVAALLMLSWLVIFFWMLRLLLV